MKIIPVFIVVILAIAVAILYFAFQNSNYISSSIGQISLQSCGANYSFFTTPMVDENSVASVLPLADFIPPDHVFPTPHAYIYTTDPKAGINKDGALLYAPTNMVLTTIAIRNLRNTAGVYKNVTDYTLVFQSCKEFYLYFHNVASLLYPPFINASLQTIKTCGTNQIYCQIPVDIPISAGQVIGTIGNSTKNIQGLDIGARDYRLPTGRNFVDPNRLCPTNGGQPNVFDRCYTVCPYSYYSNSIKQQFRMFYSNGSTINSCGTVYQDVNGTAQGYWFASNNSKSSFSPEATYIFLGNNTASTTSKVFSIGLSVAGLHSGVYSFRLNQNPSSLVNRSFANDTPGRVYCYQVIDSYSPYGGGVSGSNVVITLRMTNASELSIQKLNGTSCGNGPWIMGVNATTFIR